MGETVVSAERFEVKDSAGRVRGVFGLYEDEVALQLYDRSGFVRAIVTTRDGAVGLIFLDENSQPRFEVWQIGNASAEVLFRDRKARRRMSVELDPGGFGLVEFVNAMTGTKRRVDGTTATVLDNILGQIEAFTQPKNRRPIRRPARRPRRR